MAGKQKSHSGAKKRIKVRKSGTAMAQKPCKNHLLMSKSKRQKAANMDGFPVSVTRIKAIRRLLPGKVQLQGKKKQQTTQSN